MFQHQQFFMLFTGIFFRCSHEMLQSSISVAPTGSELNKFSNKIMLLLQYKNETNRGKSVSFYFHNNTNTELVRTSLNQSDLRKTFFYRIFFSFLFVLSKKLLFISMIKKNDSLNKNRKLSQFQSVSRSMIVNCSQKSNM